MSHHGDERSGKVPISGTDPQPVPAQRRAETAAERIRCEAAGPRCSCARTAELDREGRCSRCYGRPGGGR